MSMDLSREECGERIGHCFQWFGGYEWCKHCGEERSGDHQDDVDAIINKELAPETFKG